MNRSVSLPVAFCVSLLALAGCNESKAPEDAAKAEGGAAISTDAQRMGYSLGASMGRQFRNDKLQVDADALARGVREGFTADKLALTDEEVTAGMQQLQKSHSERMQAEQKAAADKNLAEGEAFLKDNAAKEGVVTTESGLQYKIVTAGEGPKPGAEDVVKVHYRGTLIDGTEFDSSYKRNEPVTFPVGGVIPGWVEALQLMPVGSKWELYIPSGLAYGPGGAGNQIGPNSALKFEVELLSIEPKEATEAAKE
ncbi:MAG: FKBP-type peptidyl-prolyl cis-trans isomerase [Gammaproteobacteria bacterium]|nr:FKBP-type peptidyl-prolyl cis-trans isomerase [Gammaproteobacteria bacterium]